MDDEDIYTCGPRLGVEDPRTSVCDLNYSNLSVIYSLKPVTLTLILGVTCVIFK